MSHRASSALVIALATFLAGSAVRAQQPSTDLTLEAQSGQPQPQSQSQPAPTSAPPAETASKGEQAVAASPQKAASSSAQLATVVVNGGPSADILGSARDAGFKIKIANGTTHFCKTEAPIGTRFVSESCMSEEQVTLWLSRAQDQRNKKQFMLGVPAGAH